MTRHNECLDRCSLRREVHQLRLRFGLFVHLNITNNYENGPVAALERPLPLLPFQLPSTDFNVRGTNRLKRVESLIPRYRPNLPWREVDAQRREGVVGP